MSPSLFEILFLSPSTPLLQFQFNLLTDLLTAQDRRALQRVINMDLEHR